MGRWVTSKGRRIYIPDEGEENPYAKNKLERKVGRAQKEFEEMRRRRDAGIKTNYGPGDFSHLSEHSEIQKMADDFNKAVWTREGGVYNKELYDKAEEFAKKHNMNVAKVKKAAMDAANEKYVESSRRKKEGKDPIAKEESIKEKQIAANKAQADERNGKKDTWHSETPEERKEFLRRKEVAHSLGLKNDVLGQLATDRYTPEGLRDAVKRGWITQEQADKINGKKKRK